MKKDLYKKVLEGKRIDTTKFTVTETGQIIKPSKEHVALCVAKAGIQEDVISLRIENEALKAEIEKMRCCGNCKHYVDDNCDLQCPHNCYNYDEWELKR